ncbi:Pdz Domain-Containing Protein 11 [Manis pentadactyla]|nr:Pdz Domain-Containing Protein 11 [Manis pentadactyla]
MHTIVIKISLALRPHIRREQNFNPITESWAYPHNVSFDITQGLLNNECNFSAHIRAGPNLHIREHPKSVHHPILLSHLTEHNNITLTLATLPEMAISFNVRHADNTWLNLAIALISVQIRTLNVTLCSCESCEHLS